MQNKYLKYNINISKSGTNQEDAARLFSCALWQDEGQWA